MSGFRKYTRGCVIARTNILMGRIPLAGTMRFVNVQIAARAGSPHHAGHSPPTFTLITLHLSLLPLLPPDAFTLRPPVLQVCWRDAGPVLSNVLIRMRRPHVSQHAWSGHTDSRPAETALFFSRPLMAHLSAPPRKWQVHAAGLPSAKCSLHRWLALPCGILDRTWHALLPSPRRDVRNCQPLFPGHRRQQCGMPKAQKNHQVLR